MHAVQFVPDTFAYLKTLPDKCVDVTITDPPYSKHVHENLCSGSLVGKKSVPKYELEFDPIGDFAFITDLLRITKRWVVVFCCLEDLGRISYVVPEYVRGCVWYKPNSMGQLTADRPATSYEFIALFHPQAPKKRWNGRGSYGIWQCNGTRGKKDRHPNEKPVALCSKLTALFSDPGETIFDPFCGSAAIGEAAISLSRNYVGLDFDPNWVDKASARLTSPPATYTARTDADALKLCTMKELV